MTDIQALQHDIQAQESLIERFKAGDRAAGQTLVLCYEHYLKSIVGKYVARGHMERDHEDLLQEGRIAILKGCMRYDPARGVRPLTIIAHYIQGYVKFYIRQRMPVVRLPSKKAKLYATHITLNPDMPDSKNNAKRAHLDSYEENIPDPAPLQDEILYEQERTRTLKKVVGALLRTVPVRVATVLWAHHVEKQSYVEIGEKLGVSRQRIHQLDTRGLKRVRKDLPLGLREYL